MRADVGEEAQVLEIELAAAADLHVPAPVLEHERGRDHALELRPVAGVVSRHEAIVRAGRRVRDDRGFLRAELREARERQVQVLELEQLPRTRAAVLAGEVELHEAALELAPARERSPGVADRDRPLLLARDHALELDQRVRRRLEERAEPGDVVAGGEPSGAGAPVIVEAEVVGQQRSDARQIAIAQRAAELRAALRQLAARGAAVIGIEVDHGLQATLGVDLAQAQELAVELAAVRAAHIADALERGLVARGGEHRALHLPIRPRADDLEVADVHLGVAQELRVLAAILEAEVGPHERAERDPVPRLE